MRRARALLAEALPAGDLETVAYCAQFLGSVGEMLGDADLVAAARGVARPGGPVILAALVERRLGAGPRRGPGRLSPDADVSAAPCGSPRRGG